MGGDGKAMKAFMTYGFPLGRLKIGYNESAVTEISRTDESGGTPSRLSDMAARELEEYFAGARKSFDIPIETNGTPFQERVWAALREIPYGETRSYGDIAAAVGNGRACRAVGGANNKNPISILIPCHRVIGANGAMVGYGGGMDMKTFLLALERTNIFREE